MRQQVTVITVTYNSGQVIERCLAALPPDQRVLVMDNGSTDQTAEKAARCRAEVIRNRNIGYGRAANLGFQAATTEYVLLINPDTSVSAHSLNALAARAEQHPEIGILGARLFHHHDGEKTYDRSHEFDPDGLAYTNWIHGAFMFIRKDALDRVGAFDERIFLFYEEGDLCNRFLACGYKLAVLRDAEAEHISGASSQESSRTSHIRAWHSAWSRAYFYRKHYGLRRALRKSLSKAFKYTVGFVKNGLLLNPRSAAFSGYEMLGLLSFFVGISAFDKNGRARMTKSPPRPHAQPPP